MSAVRIMRPGIPAACPGSPERYCGKAACQRERRRRWHQSRLRGDGDYRANQAQAQQAWAGRHGDYWREYRAKHPDYTDRNRLEQRRRDRRRRVARLAKMDASTPVPSGTYRLLAEAGGDLAKMDAWTVKITLISRDYTPSGGSVQRMGGSCRVG